MNNRVLKKLPSKDEMPHCIYFLCLHGEVVYIGVAKLVLARSITHRNEGMNFDEVRYIECGSPVEAFTDERRLIKKYQPVMNAQLYDGHLSVSTSQLRCIDVEVDMPATLHKEATEWAHDLGLRHGLSELIAKLIRRELNKGSTFSVPMIDEVELEEFLAS